MQSTVGAHIGALTSGIKLVVSFSCPQCTTVYQATQRRSAKAGHFTCPACQAEVLAWSGFYDFTGWTALDTESGPVRAQQNPAPGIFGAAVNRST